MVPPILMAGIESTGYKIKRSDRTLFGTTLEMEILNQCGESTLKDFEPRKRKRRWTADPSGIKPIDSVGNCID